MRRHGIRFWVLASIAALLCAILVAEFAAFPGTSYFRDKIQNADRLELATYLVKPEDSLLLTLAVVTDRADMQALANDFSITGFWVPLLDVAIANSYRIRAIKGTEVTDILIRGDGRVEYRSCFAQLSPALLSKFEKLVEKNGEVIRWRPLTSRPAD